MNFTGKMLAPINERFEEISTDVESMRNEVTALAGLGMIAFGLISIVAVSALLIAVKGRK